MPLIYIDSSGDEGFKLGRSRGSGSSQHFVTAGLVFHDAATTLRQMERLRVRLGMPPDSEFKYSDSSDFTKSAFFGMLGCCEFDIYAVVVTKDDITSPRLKGKGIDFRREFPMQLLRQGTAASGLYAYIDKTESTDEQEREFTEYLMKEVNRDLVGKLIGVAFPTSHSNRLVQAADMCGGAIHESHAKSNERYRELIADKIRDEWAWGKNRPES